MQDASRKAYGRIVEAEESRQMVRVARCRDRGHELAAVLPVSARITKRAVTAHQAPIVQHHHTRTLWPVGTCTKAYRIKTSQHIDSKNSPRNQCEGHADLESSLGEDDGQRGVCRSDYTADLGVAWRMTDDSAPVCPVSDTAW
jgi:hypothetical protein